MIKNLRFSSSLAIVAMAIFMLAPGLGWGATPYLMSGGDYTEAFTNIASTTLWPAGFGGTGTDCTEWGPVAVNATGTLGDGVKITVSTAAFSTGSSGGVQRGSANIYMLSTGTTNSCAIELFLDFTGRNAGTVSFDVATVFNSTGDRDSKLKLFYSTNGTTFTEITGTNLPFTARNNVASSASITTIALPSAFNNSSTARLRFYEYSTTTGATPTGSQPKISIDNIAVTSTAAAVPEMDVQGNSSSIADGDNSPATADWTDFGSADIAGATIDRTFTILNTGTGALTLSGTPKVAVAGTNAADFTVTAQPSSPVAATSGSTTFTVRFDPSANGTRTATLSIANDDANENPYDFTIQGTGTTSNSSVSDIIANTGFSYPTNIAYSLYQGTTLTTGNSIEVAQFDIRDGGGSADADALSTTLTALNLNVANSGGLRRIALFDGSSNVGEVAGGATANFGSLSIAAGDGASKTFSVRVSFLSSVTDNQQFSFTVSSVTANPAGSSFATGNAGGAASSTSGDNNKIEVTATDLIFDVNPGNVTLNSVMSPSPTIVAWDGNANADLDFTGTVILSTTGTFSGSATTSVPAISGTATFSNLIFSATGTGITIAGTSGSLNATGNSNAFNVTIQTPGLLLFEDNFNYTTILTSNGYTASSGTGTNNLTAGAAGLSYANYGSSGIGNALAVANTGQDDFKTFAQQNSPNTVYASFLVNISAALAGDYVFAFGPSSGSTNYRARLFIKSSVNAGNVNFGIANATTGTTYGTTDFALNTTHLVVVKYQFTSGTTATAKVFVDPNLFAEPSAFEVSVTDNTGANAPADIASFTIRQGASASAPTFVMDGIRIATNWGALLGNPQYDVNSNINSGNYNNVSILSNTLTIPSGSFVTVNGTLSNSAGTSGLVVNSGGSLIENTTGINATIESSIVGGEWHLISAPISNAFSGVFVTKYLQKHSEVTNAYTDILNSGTPLTPMKGFAAYGASTFTASYAGTLNTGNKSISLTRTVAGTGSGWNLVGNPYPCSIDWDAKDLALNSYWTKTYVNDATYIHIDASKWAEYVGGVSTNGGTKYIAPGQGFFVQVTDGHSTGSLGVNNNVKAHNATSFFKSTSDEITVVNNLVRLEVLGNGYTDETVVRFVPEATASFDGEYDAQKLFGDVAEAAQLYTLGSEALAINTMPETGSVPVGMHVGAVGVYTIAATEINDITEVSLEDTKTGIYTDLLQGSYSFSFTPGENEQRFVLHFGPLAVNDIENSFANVYSNSHTLYIDLNNNVKGDIFVYTVTGQLVATVPAAQGSSRISLENTGNYIVKVISDKNTMVRKVFVK
jgi:hypothetical protein